MNLRCKFIAAAVAVGTLCFMVWRVVLFGPPGVAIQFLRYETNRFAGFSYGSMPSGQVVFAVFMVTNGTGHSVHCVSNSGTATWEASAAKTAGGTVVGSGGAPLTAGGKNLSQSQRRAAAVAAMAATPAVASRTLNPGENGRIFMAVKDCRQPLRAWVEYEKIPRPGSLRDRLPGWLRWPKWHRAISVTIQDA